MKFPYLTYSPHVTLHPLFTGLSGDPYILDLSPSAPVYDQVDIMDQVAFQSWLDAEMKGRHSWGLASYLENRQPILSHYEQMRLEERYYHLGLDIIVDLGTPLCAPLDSVVQESGYEEGTGNYGANVLLRHDSPRFETFYTLYGHLNRERLPEKGKRFKAGETFAWIGEFHENGNWFYHTHLQVITQEGYDNGWVSKGYCNGADLTFMDRICPHPLPMFVI